MIKIRSIPFFSLKNLLEYSTYSLALMPLVSYIVNSLCIILWITLVLVTQFVDYKKPVSTPHFPHVQLFLLFAGNFFFYGISLLYTTDMKEGLSFVQTALPMLAFPFCVLLVPRPVELDREKLNRILLIFLASTLILSLYILYKYAQLHYFNQFLTSTSLNSPFREPIEQWTNKHPVYISLYIAFSIFIAIREIKGNKPWTNLLFIVSICVFLLLLLLLASRGPLAGLMIGVIFAIFFRLKKLKTKVLVAVIFLGGFLLFIRLTPAIYSRIQEFHETALKPPVAEHHNSVNIRVGIWLCAWQIISRNPWFGVGAGDEKEQLTKCYTGYSTDAYQKHYYNTHNQYLNTWMVTGIFSLILFIAANLYAFVLALRSRNTLLLIFVTLCCSTFLTENVLTRQAGVVFYYYFLIILIYFSLTKKLKTNPEYVKVS